MPSVAVTVPYMRTSMLHMPRRDLVLAVADSLYVRMTVVDGDNWRGNLLEISGGIGGPSAQMNVWADVAGYHNDYGMLLPVKGHILWQGAGKPIPGQGAFDFAFASGTIASWPMRCGWSLQLNYDAASADVLLSGAIHVKQLGVPFVLSTPPLLTSDSIPVLTDDSEQVFT